MNLSLPYLQERHEYWKLKIGETGIWNPDLFGPVSIKIRPKCKSYNALFSRRYIIKKGIRTLNDRIFIYKNSETFEPKFLDSLIVHEMIHQYIIQTGIKDTSTHGKVFKDFMTRINERFSNELSIHIRDHNPSCKESGPGETLHCLLLLWTDKFVYCCVIHPKRLEYFVKLIKKYKKDKTIRDYKWAYSRDMRFERHVRCSKTLHGIKMSASEIHDFCSQYNVISRI